ncbi:MAG: hypothetical protein JO337_09895 [Acidimicrobiales bacterium]|nr:hypothetical protein [Acidimicrobiales bacterium]
MPESMRCSFAGYWESLRRTWRSSRRLSRPCESADSVAIPPSPLQNVPKSPFSFPHFRALLDRVEAERVETFAEIEAEFLHAMGAFDARMAAGELTAGENQNKGLFFNELIARLVERCAGFGVAQRGKRPGILLPHVDVDLCYPADRTARPALIAEIKMAGTPKHPGNPTAGPLGRRASADVDKRIREIALNVIDLKLADVQGGTTTIGDITSWIQETRPRFFAIFGLRVIDSNDHRNLIGRFQYLANSYANGVGIALFEPVDSSTPEGRVTYRSIPPPGGMSIDDAVKRMCRVIKSAASEPTKPIPPDELTQSQQQEP